jgi:hypothetical protein
MTEHVLDDLQVLTRGKSKASCSVPQIMQADGRQACSGEELTKGPQVPPTAAVTEERRRWRSLSLTGSRLMRSQRICGSTIPAEISAAANSRSFSR